MTATGTTATTLFCPACGALHDIHAVVGVCNCGSPLLVDYDYDRAGWIFRRIDWSARDRSIWKYRELLPVFDDRNIVTLGEGGTPLLPSLTIGERIGCPRLFFKDESGNPTGSFKARGLSVAVSRAKELGIKKLIIPTAGNAGSAVAAYAARAQMECLVIMPKDVPAPFLTDCAYFGAQIELVDGTIRDCGLRASDRALREGWFSVATLKEPYRIEGKKIMGYELAEQFGYVLPDVVIYPTGGGTGLIGMWKAFDELYKMGLVRGKKPRMISVQAEGCAPIVKAFLEGKDHAETWENPRTLAAGLRVPGAIGDFLMLRAIRESGGTALTVTDDEIMKNTRELALNEGIFPAPEGGAALAALRRLLDMKIVAPSDTIVVFITGSGYKYLDVLENDLKGKTGRP